MARKVTGKGGAGSPRGTRSGRKLVGKPGKSDKSVQPGKAGGSRKPDAVAKAGRRGNRTSSCSRSQGGSKAQVRGAARSVSSRSGGEVKSIDYAAAGGSIDARSLKSEDLVSKTLRQTSGPLGVASRPKVIDFSARLKERKEAHRKKVALRVAEVLGVLVVVAALAWFLVFSPVFLLRRGNIEVSGQNAWVGRDQIMRIADRQVGKSLFVVSSSGIEDQLKNIPGVTRAEVTKNFPTGMSVKVKAQEPAAMLRESNGRLGAVDSQGRLLNAVQGTPATGIPVIEVDSIGHGLKSRAVQQALKILGYLPKSMRQRVSKVTAQTQDSVTTELDQGNYVVIWGDASQIRLKQAVVDKIINDPTKIGDKHQVDVSAPLKPIIK